MIARVTTLQAKADKLDEVKKYYDEVIFPTVRQRKGFQGGYFLSDRKTGTCFCVGFWDSEKDALNDERSKQFITRVSSVTDLVETPPVWSIYEVASKY
jgi:hypothetical protein